MKKLLSLALALMLLALPTLSSMAEEAEPRAAILLPCSVSVSAAGGGVLYITFTARSSVECTSLGVSSYYVQQQNSSGGWTRVTGSLSGATGSGTTFSFSRNFNGIPNTTYRVVATFTATADGETQTSSRTSGSIFARSIE